MFPANDPVLSALHEAKEQYQTITDSLQDEVNAERRESEKQRQKAVHLQEIIQDIHRGLFSKDTYLLILETCLKLTGATRGIYLAAEEASEMPRLRASIGFMKDSASGLTAPLVELYSRVAQQGETLVSNKPGDVADFRQPADPSENVHSFIAVPVALLSRLSGVIIAADK